MRKISIIGLGNVGATVAHTIVERSLCDTLFLFDKKEGLAEAEVSDLSDGFVRRNGHINIVAGDLKDLDESDIIVFAPGDISILQKNDDRLKEFEYTKTCAEEWGKKIKDSNFKGIIVSITNPCDVIAEYLQKLSGIPRERVIGTGTILDTARMKNSVARKLNIDPNCVDGYVIAEHGNSQFVAWSSVSIATKPILEIFDKNVCDEIEEETKIRAFETIKAKGDNSYGISNSTSIVIESIFQDSRTILPVSSYSKKDGCYIGHPTIVGREGVLGDYELKLNEEENVKWNKSIKTIKDTLPKI